MTPERWSQARTIFGAAMDLDAGGREAYVRQTCGGDTDLFREVMSLLKADPVQTRLVNPLARPAESLLLKERYRVQRELGRGGLGVVLLARDETLHGRQVVVKMPLDPSPSDSWFTEKFAQEVKALALIDHPGVVGALDSGVTPDGRPFLVMQYVEGKPLTDELRPEGLPFASAARLLEQIGQALGAAHAHGIWHRDLKPANIMVQRLDNGREHVRLIDFGLATVLEGPAGEVGTRIAGTPSYMAPEQLQGRVSAASDIYAVGVIAYELLTGKKPFAADNIVTLHELQSAGVRVKPSSLRPDVPKDVESLILQALSFRPENRPPSAAAFGAALADGLSASRPVPPPTRRRSMIGAVSAAVVTLAAGGAWWKMRPVAAHTMVAPPLNSVSWSVMVQAGRTGPPEAAAPGAPLRPSDGFFLQVRAPQGGYLYLLSDDSAKDSLVTLGSLLLHPGGENRIPETHPFEFDEPGAFDLLCAWSRDPVAELEPLVPRWIDSGGAIGDASERTRIRQFVKSLPQAAPVAGTNRVSAVETSGPRMAWKLRVEAK